MLRLVVIELCAIAKESGIFDSTQDIYTILVQIELEKHYIPGVTRQDWPRNARILLVEAKRQLALVSNTRDGRYALAYLLDKAMHPYANSSDVELLRYCAFIRTIIYKLCDVS
jgi:hypothetical protein